VEVISITSMPDGSTVSDASWAKTVELVPIQINAQAKGVSLKAIRLKAVCL
jgi:hypothetical protein